MSSVIKIGQGVTALWGSKMALSYYFGQWLMQQLVLPYRTSRDMANLTPL